MNSGTIDVSQTSTGQMLRGLNIDTLTGSTSAFDLAPGTYWLGLAPVLNISTQAFVATTSGDGGYGQYLHDGNSFLNYTAGGFNFMSTAYLGYGDHADFSYGIVGNPVVPEPGSMLVFGMGLASFVPFLRRRK